MSLHPAGSQGVIKPLVERLPGGLRLNLHKGQRRAYASKARFVCVIAGHQSGKTSFGPFWLLREIATRGNGDYLVVTPSFPLLEMKALPEFLELFEHTCKLGKFSVKNGIRIFTFSEKAMRRMHGLKPNGELNYNPHQPTRVIFGHADNPQSLESATAKAAWLDEAGQKRFRLSSWEAIQRRLSLHVGRVLITTTPYDLGWLKTEVYDRWRAGDSDYDVINFKSSDNPLFNREEAERYRRTLPKWKYEMFVLGLFSKPAGLIYDCFDDIENQKYPFQIPHHWKRVIGIDFGGRNTAAVYYAIDPRTKIAYQYREYYPQAVKTSYQHFKDIMTGELGFDCNDGARMVYYDQSKYTIIGGSLSEIQWRIEFTAHGAQIHPTYIKEVELGIDRVYAYVQLRMLKLFLGLCPKTLDEFHSYSREVDERGEVLEGTIEDKEVYHLLDATRYAVSYMNDPTTLPDLLEKDAKLFNPDGSAEDLITQILRGEQVDEMNPDVIEKLVQMGLMPPRTPRLMHRKRQPKDDEDYD